jgi:hypothetical protein
MPMEEGNARDVRVCEQAAVRRYSYSDSNFTAWCTFRGVSDGVGEAASGWPGIRLDVLRGRLRMNSLIFFPPFICLASNKHDLVRNLGIHA